MCLVFPIPVTFFANFQDACHPLRNNYYAFIFESHFVFVFFLFLEVFTFQAIYSFVLICAGCSLDGCIPNILDLLITNSLLGWIPYFSNPMSSSSIVSLACHPPAASPNGDMFKSFISFILFSSTFVFYRGLG